jgi:type I restriction enzyme, S subunit
MEKVLLNQSLGTTIQNVRMDSLKNFPIPIPSLEEQTKIIVGLNKIKQSIQNAQQIIDNLKLPLFVSLMKPVEFKKLGEVASFEYGYTATAGKQGEFRYIRITDIDEYGNISEKDKKYVDLVNEADKEKYLLKEKDLIVARIGSVGKTAIFENRTITNNYSFQGEGKAIFASYLIRINLDKEVILPEYY